MVITSIIEASVAVGRLTSYLTAEEIQPDAITVKPPVEMIGEESVLIRDGCFSWNRHENKTVLKNINYSAHKGDLSCIVGRVGAGKSSILQSILGDLWKVKGEVQVHGTVAYVSQSPWIMNATVRRAVYARADIYVMDDCLSAVDSHVGRHIIDNVLGPKGLLNSKTRILATNSIPVLVESDYICMLKEGEIAERGTYRQLLAMKGAVFDLIKTAGQNDSGQSSLIGSPADSDSETSTVIEAAGTSQEKDLLEEAQEGLGSLEAIKAGPGSSSQKPRAGSMATLRRARGLGANFKTRRTPAGRGRSKSTLNRAR